jgi:dTDP-4-dehydrorhamnose 3,5-epimerase
MHYQADLRPETKLVRCVRGSIYDVVVDLRPDSPTHRRWHAVELSAENGREVYVPKGMAHGFQTLEDDTEILYQMGACYVAELQRGVRYDDPALGIEWPDVGSGGRILSERDAGYPDIQR